MPGVRDVLGVAIVGAERNAPRAVLLNERQQRAQVASHRRLADEQPHPGTESLAPFLDGERLVVGVDACSRVGLQLGPEQAGCVPVDVARAVQRQLRQLVRRAGNDAGEVHHLREPEHPAPAHQRLEVARRQGAPRRLEGRRGNARRGHEEDVQLEIRARVEQPVHAVDAEDVRDLVRIGHDRRRSQREHQPRELVHHELHRLEVHVRVDEARNDERAGGVERLASLVRPDPGDHAVDDRDVGVQPLAREDRQHAPAAHHEIGGLIAASDRKTALQPFHRRERKCASACRIVARSSRQADRRSR